MMVNYLLASQCACWLVIWMSDLECSFLIWQSYLGYIQPGLGIHIHQVPLHKFPRAGPVPNSVYQCLLELAYTSFYGILVHAIPLPVSFPVALLDPETIHFSNYLPKVQESHPNGFDESMPKNHAPAEWLEGDEDNVRRFKTVLWQDSWKLMMLAMIRGQLILCCLLPLDLHDLWYACIWRPPLSLTQSLSTFLVKEQNKKLSKSKHMQRGKDCCLHLILALLVLIIPQPSLNWFK